MISVLLGGIAAALAGPVEIYGFDARTMGRGGGGVALADGPGDLFRNPALLQQMELFEAQLGYTLARSSFAPFPDVYMELFSQFRQRIAWVVIGPGLVDMGGMYDTTCNSLGTGSSAFRYEYLVYDSNGLKVDITTPEPECETADFKEALDRLGVLLQNLSTTFALSSVPVKETIRVAIDGKPIVESEEDGTDELGLPVFTDGWTYRADENAVVFHGEAIPAADADVRVYYKPLDGMPRELPF